MCMFVYLQLIWSLRVKNLLSLVTVFFSLTLSDKS